MQTAVTWLRTWTLMGVMVGLAACKPGQPQQDIAIVVAPSEAAVEAGGHVSFSAAVSGTENRAVTWSVEEGDAGGTITPQGRYTAPQVEGIYHVLATSVANTSKSARATVFVSVRGNGTPIAVSVSPTSAQVQAGATQTFTASVTGTNNTAVTWSVVESGGGSISAAGVYTAPATPGTYHVVATSVADSRRSATAEVVVLAPGSLSVSVSPNRAVLNFGQSQTFSATVANSADQRVTWSVVESGGGTITSTGVYTAPATSGTYHVVATSVADPRRSATAEAVVLAPTTISVSVSPVRATLNAGQSQTFSAAVTNSADQRVTWRVMESGGGSITAAGVYTAPATAGTYHVVATSVADPSRSATAEVAVLVPVAVSVSVTPARYTLSYGATQTFTAVVTNTDDPSVVWNVEDIGGGTVDDQGNYTAPNTPGTYRLRATSLVNTSQSAIALITVGSRSVPAVALSPAVVTVRPREYVPFNATVTHVSWTAQVTWSVEEPSNGGGITQGGTYLSPEQPGIYRVVATSEQDRTRQARATIRVLPATDVKVTVAPSVATLTLGRQQTFSASVSGSANQAVTWSVSGGSANGSITPDGTYTPPSVPGLYYVVAISVAEPSKGISVPVLVGSGRTPSLAIDPARVTLAPGAFQSFQSFSATVSGTAVSGTATAWTVLEGASGGVVTPQGLYRAPSRTGTYHLASTSQDGSKPVDAIATIDVRAPQGVSVSVAPSRVSVPAGSRQSFLAHVAGSTNSAVTWSVQGVGAGSITPEGVYTAPSTSGGRYTVMATSVADPTKLAVVEVRVEPSWSSSVAAVSVTPTRATVTAGSLFQFTGTLSDPYSSLEWEVLEGALGGVLTTTGLYVAPTTPGTYHVLARTPGYQNGLALAVVEVVAPTGLSVSLAPNNPRVQTGRRQSFLAKVVGGTDTRVMWSATGGSFSPDGTWTAPSSPGAYEVTATSVANPSQRATTTVTVVTSGAPSIELTPTSLTVAPRGFAPLSTTSLGVSSTAQAWKVLEGPRGGALTYNGTYIAPEQPGTYHVQVTSDAYVDSAYQQGYALAAVHVVAPATGVSTSVAPATVQVGPGGKQTFSASVAGTPDTRVTWSATGGTISEDGTWTAPSAPGLYQVKATSVVDPSQSATALASVTSGSVSVSVSPAVVRLAPGATVQLSAIGHGAAYPWLYWRVLPEKVGGALSDTSYLPVEYRAPWTPGVYYVEATSDMYGSWPSPSALVTIIVE